MATTTWNQKSGMTSATDVDNLESYAEQAEASKDAAAASATSAATSATEAAASAASIDPDNIDINGGTIDDAVIGGMTPAAISGTTGTFSALTVDTDAIYAASGTNRVGINNLSPATTLDVGGSIYFSSILRSTNGGSAASPSIQPGLDADTGIFHPAVNTIGFSTTGTERMRIDSAGSVGIGTTKTVSTKLLISGGESGSSSVNSNYNEVFVENSGNTGITFMTPNNAQSGIAYGDTDSNAAAYEYYNHADGGKTHIYESFARWYTSGSERMRIDSAGRVGINATPSMLLQVSAQSTSTNATIGATEPTYTDNFRSSLLEYWPIDSTGTQLGVSRANLGSLRFLNTANAAIGTNGGSPLIFSTNNTERMRIDSSGRVGIGTSSPTNLLDVSGAGTTTIGVRTTDTSGVNVGRVRVDYTGGGGGTASQVDLRAGDNYTYLISPTNTPLLFGTNNTEAMRITSSGNVGIGTSSPNSKLSVVGLPTSSAGLSAGDIWNDGGTLKIV